MRNYINVNTYGLTEEEAKIRLKKYGYNEIISKAKISIIKILAEQFNDFIVWVLIAATVISAFMGEKSDAITILIIILMDSILGFIQEYKTEKSLEALKELISPNAKVIREGKLQHIKARDIVIGDIIVFESGDRVPADAVVLNGESIQSDESILTGESLPVDKSPEKKGVNAKNESIVYMGCSITKGKGAARVIATGMETEVGKIANMLDEIKQSQTPLQKKLDELGKLLVIGCIAVCGAVSCLGIFRGEDPYSMFMTGVSLAVAAIPEGLPAVVTVSLAIGVQRMMKKQALIRKLPAVETLGCTNIICSDKTGTLTQNKMTVKKLYLPDSVYDVSGSGYNIEGEITLRGKEIEAFKSNSIKTLIESAVICNNSTIENNNFSGDPTEIALLVLGLKTGIDKKTLEKSCRIIKENPFDSDRKMMSIVCSKNGEKFMMAKGAPENILKCCTGILMENGEKKITNENKLHIIKKNNDMAQLALRVIAVAFKRINDGDTLYKENDLILVGLIGMMDPPRPEVKDSIIECRLAGIVPVMITGDHKLTAEAIAKEIKLIDNNNIVMTGEELERIDDERFDNIIDNVRVFARVNPSHKYRIVKALKRKGHVVAMTGDGVNDAPAVKEADIGIAMGATGTDVTREASAMILLDDNFATIVSAVREGRVIYDNIRKFIRYLLSCNIGEVLTMFITSLLRLPIPLMPIQILLVNLATDGLPAMALSMEPPEKDIMMRNPRKKNESIFSNGLYMRIIFRGILIGLCTVLSFVITLGVLGDDIILGRTVALSTLIMSQLFHVFECKSEHNSIFKIGILNNLYLVISVLISILMLCLTIYNPYLQKIFHTQSLDLKHWILVLIFSGTMSILSELFWFGKNK